MAGEDPSSCPRRLEFEEEIRVLQLRLAACGQYVTYSPGPNTNPDLDQELRRWHAVSPKECRWLRAMRDQDRLKSRIGALAAEVERLRDYS
jgi:hypothetical protein